MFRIAPQLVPPLEPDFLPAALWHRAYRELAAQDAGARRLIFALEQPGGATRHETIALSADHPSAALTLRHAERLLKSLLWHYGGYHVLIAGAPEIAAQLAQIYGPAGERAFDQRFMGEQVYGRPFVIEACEIDRLPPPRSADHSLGRHLDGCRIGFDLGGSERKIAAVVDGKAVYTGEMAWSPYFRADPSYHVQAIDEALRRAAEHLPRVDAIGGGAAGIYVDNEVRVASLFRGVPPAQFESRVRRIFFELRERWGGVPFEVANDGEVAALAGAMSLGTGAVLGTALGTSQAGGFVTAEGNITSWLNELAFSPVDYQPAAPRDEWSGDVGCGERYFSQQGVARFARRAGFAFPEGMPVSEQTTAVQAALQAGDPRADRVYESLGICLGYALAHYSDFYPFHHVLIFGGVTAGPAGGRIVANAQAVLEREFPDLAAQAVLHLPAESLKRHGPAIAAASLPALSPRGGRPSAGLHKPSEMLG